MKLTKLIEKLQQHVEDGDGDLEVACDYPLGDIAQKRNHYMPGDWSTVETVSKRYMDTDSGEGTIGTYEPKQVIFLDWRT
jgi:hypothetical protein